MSSPAPMDIVPGDPPEYDDNGILYQPKWYLQVDRGTYPNVEELCHGVPFEPHAGFPQSCTTNPISTDSAATCDPLPLPIARAGGHINWCPATYEGRIFWDDHSDDDDYNVNLVPSVEGAGFTVGNLNFRGHEPGAFECEFDSDETIDHFNTPWWNEFHDAVDNDEDKARRMMDNNRAIITGLLGIDSQHSSYVELHPVWALGLEVQPPHQGGGTFGSRRWAMFIRNWGNEGWCSNLDHQIQFYKNRYSFLLPYPYEVSSDLLSFANSRSNWLTNHPGEVTGPWVSSINWFGSPRIRLTFTDIPDPNKHPFIEGEIILEFNWKSRIVPPSPKSYKKESYKRSRYEKKKSEGAQYFERLKKVLSPNKMKTFQQDLEKSNDVKDSNLQHKSAKPKSPMKGRLKRIRRFTVGRPNLVTQPSIFREKKNKNLYNALLKAFDGEIPKEFWSQ